MNNIHKTETIEELKDYINSLSADKLRPLLLSAFDRLECYKNLKEWNELVRVCEALAIIGWGDREAFEALAYKWMNGAFYTELQNSFFEQKAGSCHRWNKQKETYVIDDKNADNTDYGISKFASQRNKLPKSPIRWSRSGNYQSSLQPLVDDLEILRDKIIRQTRPELYGNTFSHIGIYLRFSYHDDKNQSVRSEYFHDEKDIPKDYKDKNLSKEMPRYYIRPRLKIGRLSIANNELKLEVKRHYTRAFGYLDLAEQKKIILNDFIEIIDILAGKLKKKKIEYNTELLKQDVIKIFAEW